MNFGRSFMLHVYIKRLMATIRLKSREIFCGEFNIHSHVFNKVYMVASRPFQSKILKMTEKMTEHISGV